MEQIIIAACGVGGWGAGLYYGADVADKYYPPTSKARSVIGAAAVLVFAAVVGQVSGRVIRFWFGF